MNRYVIIYRARMGSGKGATYKIKVEAEDLRRAIVSFWKFCGDGVQESGEPFTEIVIRAVDKLDHHGNPIEPPKIF